MNASTDPVVTSVHKMGGAIEQSSVFHLQGDLVNPTVLKQREDLLGTTSSSSLVYATLDGWRRHMVEQGEQLLGGALQRATRIRAAIGEIDPLRLMGEDDVGTGGTAQLDPLRLTIDVRGSRDQRLPGRRVVARGVPRRHGLGRPVSSGRPDQLRR
jgi:arginine decarboxylase